jgi:hypothetical protein
MDLYPGFTLVKKVLIFIEKDITSCRGRYANKELDFKG